MKKLITLFCTSVLTVVCSAQLMNYPQFGKDLKLTAEPVTGLERLSVGDEGYVTFRVRNEGESTYSGPLYLRLFNREQSHQVLVKAKNKLKPGKEYQITTVFPTDRLEAYTMYFIGFEFEEDGHNIAMAQTNPKPLKSFMLLQPIINAPEKKSPVKARIKEIKKK
ncbi:MAG: hypothetical protein IK006_05615 [Bacteroidaceae bacterium]|nr:hypothetical protein [Bacteroidaceae bacterium]